MNFSKRYKFSDWPNKGILLVAAGVYVIWDKDELVYCGMSGRSIEKAKEEGKKKYGIITRLDSHASGRLSGDQFCVYVANRLVIPKLSMEDLPLFASDELRLDTLTKKYISDKLEYQYKIVETSSEAYDIENKVRSGEVFGAKPLLNPLE